MDSFTQHTMLSPGSKTAGWVTKNGDKSILELETHTERKSEQERESLIREREIRETVTVLDL